MVPSGALSFTSRITSSVNLSHPFPAWLFASPLRTVRAALRRRTPCPAQESRHPCRGGGMPTSSAASRKMFLSDGGGGTPLRTEKARPCPCPGPWYGSCPTTTALTRSRGHRLRAAKTSPSGGYTSAPEARSDATNSARDRKSSVCAYPDSASVHDGSVNPRKRSATASSVVPADAVTPLSPSPSLPPPPPPPDDKSRALTASVEASSLSPSSIRLPSSFLAQRGTNS
mmetsp:Transcript_28597/g.84229  ORF Transcript_28597/g.84229 Transcript_28597/m.84229 type:complete len:228 (+) Transcript_28597:525-1208(+)